MSKAALWFGIVGVISLVAFVVAGDECKTIDQPDVIDVAKQADKSEFVITFSYPADNITVKYKCPQGDDGGDFSVYAIAKSDTATDQKMLNYFPVPGVQDKIRLKQQVTDFKFETVIDLDEKGFVFTGICCIKDGKASKPWNANTQTPDNFPFTFTEAGQLRFDLNKCNSTQPA